MFEVTAKKSLGQHFLNSPKALLQMVKAGEVTSDDVVFEIGPGTGVLTASLLQTGATVVVCEIDERSIEVLNEKFKTEIEHKKLFIFNHDVQKPLPAALLKLLTGNKQKSYKLIANIPYYITGFIIRNFLECDHQPSTMVLLVQKEVAERIVCKDDKQSVLSLSIYAYGNPQYIGTVPKGAFIPPPKVDSAVIAITGITKKRFNNKQHEQLFFDVIKAAFLQKRKTLRNSIMKFPNVIEKFKTLDIESTQRPERVEIDKWVEATK